MTGLLPLRMTSLAQLYGDFDRPFSIQDHNRPTTSTLFPRRTTQVLGPVVQTGNLPCPPLLNFQVPEVSITYLPNAIVTATGAVIYDETHLITETLEGSPADNGLAESNGAVTLDMADLDYCDEIVICIGRNGTYNYSLFNAEVLPLALVCGMNGGIESLRVPILFPSFMSAQALAIRKELLHHFSITEARLCAPPGPLTRYRGVVVAKVNDRYVNHRISQVLPHVAGKLRSEMTTAYSPPSRRLYISRQSAGNRRIENFDELSATVLQPFGLMPVELDAMPLAQQIDLFAKADLVVAEHGAGLVNTMFMRPGATVVELTPAPMVGRWMFRLIAHHSRLNYCFGSFDTPPGWVWNRDGMTVPCAPYRHILERAG